MRTYGFVAMLIVCGVITLMTVNAVADDWPHWRGPQYNGISAEVNWIGDWPATEPNVLWEQQVGMGFSSIAVADGRVYTMGSALRTIKVASGGARGGMTQKEVQMEDVFCLDPNTGDVLWIHSYPAALRLNDLYAGGPHATPTIADSNVYTFSKQGLALCLDAHDGTVLWERDLVAEHGVRVPRYGFAGSPYVDANLVVFNAGTHGTALYLADGSLAWGTGTSDCGYSTPLPFDFEGQRCLALMGQRTFAAVHPQTGQVVWTHPWVTKYNANIPDPIVHDQMMFVSTGYNEGAALFDVVMLPVLELWFKKNVQTFLNTAVFWEGFLYGANDFDKTLCCVEFSTGDIMWTEKGFGNGGVTLADGKLIALSGTGNLCIAEASPAGYHELGKGRILSDTCWTVPVLAHGKIYARNAAGKLVCVELMPAESEPEARRSR